MSSCSVSRWDSSSSSIIRSGMPGNREAGEAPEAGEAAEALFAHNLSHGVLHSASA